MPLLEEDGTQISGSAIIARYLGEKYGGCCSMQDTPAGTPARAAFLSFPAGLAGSTNVENAQIASAVDAVGDVAREVGKFVFEKDEERKV